MSITSPPRLGAALFALRDAGVAWRERGEQLRIVHESAAKALVTTLEAIATDTRDSQLHAIAAHTHGLLYGLLAQCDDALEPAQLAIARAANEVRAALGAANLPDRHWGSMTASIRGDRRATALIVGLPPADATVEDIDAWWKALDKRGQAYAVEQFGDQLGRIDGISIPARSECNEARLRDDRKQLHGALRDLRLQPGGSAFQEKLRRRDAEEIQAKIDGLDDIERRLLAERALHREAYLIDLDTEGYGTFRFSYRNPQTAKRVVSYVSGGGTSLGKAWGALEDAGSLLETVEGHPSRPDGDTAVIANSYQIKKPIEVSVVGMAVPRAAAPGLARYQHGLRVTHEPVAEGEEPTRYVGIQHSLGNVAAAEAARMYGYAVDALVINGIVWTGSDHADELGIPEVYATLRANDPIGLFRGIHLPHRGPQPVNEEFGATVFESGPGPSGWLPRGTSYGAHFGYLRDSLTLRQNAEIIIGNQPDHRGSSITP